MKRIPTSLVLKIILALILFSGSVYIASSPDASVVGWYNNDDGFFYFKAAQNIVAGNGISFDGINPTNGFHPLWMLICVGVFAVVKSSLILPLRVIILIFGIFCTASGLLLFDGLKRKFPEWMAFCLTFGLLSSWFVYTYTFSGGLESGLSCFMMIWLWNAAVRWKSDRNHTCRSLLPVGLLAVFTVFSRLDMIFLVGFIGIWLIIDEHRSRAWLLTDLAAPLLFAISATILRSGFAVFHHYHSILAFTGLLIVSTVPAFYLLGFYSHPTRWLSKVSPFLRSLIVWGVAAILVWVGSLIGFRTEILSTFSVSILLILTLLWFGYICILRGLVFSKQIGSQPGEPIPWKSLFGWIKFPAAYFGPVFTLLMIYFLWNLLVFHTPMPVSGQIKQWWGSLGQTTYGSAIQTWRGLQEYLLSGDSVFGYLMNLPLLQSIGAVGKKWIGETLVWAIFVLGGFWVWFRLRGSKSETWTDDLALLPFFAATLYRLVYFYISGYVHMRSWYWTVETFFGFLLLISLFYGIGVSARPARAQKFAISGIVILWTAIQLTGWVANILRVYPMNGSARNNRDYLIVPEMVAEATQPGAIIGTPGGGSLSYFIQDRTIVNLDGLMNSKEYFDALKRFDTRTIMQNSKLEYVFGNENTLSKSSPYNRIFSNCLEPDIKIFGKTVYRYLCK